MKSASPFETGLNEPKDYLEFLLGRRRIEMAKLRKNNGCPSRISGTLEISKSREGVFIGGDPQGLRSLANLLIWLANVDQKKHPSMPDDEREHVHLYSDPASVASCLTRFSVTTELCRLDAKGTGEFPEKYSNFGKKTPKR
jgi:hypothetical protein